MKDKRSNLEAKTMKAWAKITNVEIVHHPIRHWELKVFHADGSWMYFSRSFASAEAAKEVALKLSKKVTQEVA